MTEPSKESLMLAEKSVASEFNHTEHIYIDICGDLVAGTLLSQILYWFKPSADGTIKVRVRKEGHLWLAKKREDWWKEIRITPKQYDRAIKTLQNLGLVESKLFKFNGIPTVHIRPIAEAINKATTEWVQKKAVSYEIEPKNNENSPISTKGKNGFSPKVKMDFPHKVKSITENTITENTTEVTSKYRSTNYSNKDFKKSNTPILKSMDSPCSASVDLHNLENLSATLDDCIHIAKGYDGHEYAYILFSSFAQEYKRVRHRKHTRVNRDKLIEYVDKLTAFRVKKGNGETYRTFSIYDYREKDIVAMVDDYFNTKFDDCDYSLHHFMNDSVLATRFWHLEKMLGEEEEVVASI